MKGLPESSSKSS